jgi:hypothetical protein
MGMGMGMGYGYGHHYLRGAEPGDIWGSGSWGPCLGSSLSRVAAAAQVNS